VDEIVLAIVSKIKITPKFVNLKERLVEKIHAEV
jgi:hypothetical protein